MIGFDVAALVFLGSAISLFSATPSQMRRSAAENDANRLLLLVINVALAAVTLIAIVALLQDKAALTPADKLLVVLTLALAWGFGNAVYTLHYAHLFYSSADGGKDAAGLVFPGTKEPRFADFAYFAYTLGVAVQTSDVQVTSPQVRNVVTVHCIVGFFFNLGVLALMINVLGSS
ncbi:DUF1345 domain-containing protein [Sphingomonas sinipercae]|uniref:DUF1345 domain-containing protein n=2 Tax=Sphingomonas sinipercae TaxID=2714944 RepID=A0A6G7ZQU3_9SPHN|nr:DUF1345 domain-containing protein [Sphingomonas sinipercae]